MLAMATSLYNDEAGFIVSAELVLVSTILVIGMVVGLAEISNGINEELEDVASAIGSVNQTFRFSGLSGHKGFIVGSSFNDQADYCDGQFDITCDNNRPVNEAPTYN
ncbi:MAG: branched-chain amino acid aminotransferase [Planctomycetaceae bacterium]|nr:branched-chain amino acid aminotransferase [Planctomycetaceae bacterium]